MIPLSTPDLRGNEMAYLRQCVEDNWVSTAGPFVTEIERRIAALCGMPAAVATMNGTTALQLALTAAGIGPGVAVVVPDWTFAATVNAVVHSGAEPVFADVSALNLTIDPEAVAEAFRHNPKPIRAVVAVHVLGRTPDLRSLKALCDANQAVLIEDAAGSLGASYDGQPVGCYGEAGIFSFNGNKIATAGGGGMIVSRNETLLARARHLCQQARTGDDYSHDDIGFNYRMTNLNAAVGLAQLERLDEMKLRRLKIQQRYDVSLLPSNRLTALPRAAWDGEYCWLYSLRAADAEVAASLVTFLRASGIEARHFWKALSPQRPFTGFNRFGGTVSDTLSGSVVSLPCSSHLSDADQDIVIAAVRRWEQAA